LDALEFAPLNVVERQFAERLLRYYRAGVEPGHRLRSAVAALGLANYFCSAQRPWATARLIVRPLLGGI
jgi:hypothetical protein